MDKAAIKIALTTIARQALSALAGGLSVWTSKRGLDLGGEFALLAGAVAIFVVNTLWGIGERLLQKWKTNAARLADPNMTHKELDAVASEVPKTQRILEALTEPKTESSGIAR